MEDKNTVRKLTPSECALLQGFPPDWASDIEHSDSAEYKMWGNGIALPCIIPMMKEMSEAIRKEIELEQETENDSSLSGNSQ